MNAKDTSRIGMIVGAIGLTIVFISVIVKFFMNDFTFTIEQSLSLIIIGVSPSIPFSPVYVSTWLDKIIELKNKKSESES